MIPLTAYTAAAGARPSSRISGSMPPTRSMADPRSAAFACPA